MANSIIDEKLTPAEKIELENLKSNPLMYGKKPIGKAFGTEAVAMKEKDTKMRTRINELESKKALADVQTQKSDKIKGDEYKKWSKEFDEKAKVYRENIATKKYNEGITKQADEQRKQETEFAKSEQKRVKQEKDVAAEYKRKYGDTPFEKDLKVQEAKARLDALPIPGIIKPPKLSEPYDYFGNKKDWSDFQSSLPKLQRVNYAWNSDTGMVSFFTGEESKGESYNILKNYKDKLKRI